jgi:DNA repair protein RecO (recombination protein O)
VSGSPIEKTTAITLRVIPYSNTSHVVTWLTRDRGRLATLIKGACRPKSQFLGQYDLGYTCELLYYARERSGLYIAREATALDSRAPLRSSAAHAMSASYLCYLGLRTTHPHHSDPHTFEALETALDTLIAHTPTPDLLLWAEMRILTAHGLAPQLRQCAACRVPLAAFQSTRFSTSNGGLLCERCNPRDPEATTLGCDVLALMRQWRDADHPDALRNIRCTRKQRFQFQQTLGSFLAYHMDIAPSCRHVAYRLVDASQS